MKNILLLITALMISCAVFSQKRVEIIPDVIEAQPGEEVFAPVVVTGFDTDTSSVAAVEFYIEFDNTVLTYVEPSNFSDLLPESEWFYSNSSDTLSRFACNWAQPSLLNVNIPDGTTLFEIKFIYNGGESELDFDETAGIFVHIDDQFNLIELQVEYFNGLITFSGSEFETVWNGTGTWNESTFWSNGVPTPTSVAIIESGEVTIQSGFASTKEMTVNAGATVKILPNKGLTVDTLLTNNGMIWILSDETGTGSLIVNNLVEGSGNYQIERYMSALADHLVGAPVSGTSVDLFGGTPVSRWDESTASFTPLAAGTTIESGKGYLAEPALNSTFVFESSTVHQGDVPISLSYSYVGIEELKGLNLITNPYPSAIEWNSGDWSLSNTGMAVYIWQENRYLVWNGYIGNVANGIIPAMQGFIVRAYDAGASITIPNNSRLHSNQPFYKEKEEPDNYLKIEFGEVINSEPGPVQDVVFYHVNNMATNGFDTEHDAYKISGSAGTTVAYSMLNEANFEKMAIDVRYFDGSLIPSLPIGFEPATTGTYYLRLQNAESINEATPITLQDLALEEPFPDDEIDMRSVNFIYSFNADPADDAYRFILHFSPVGVNDLTYDDQIGIENYDNKLVLNNNCGSPQQVHLEIFDLMGRNLITESYYLIDEQRVDINAIKGVFIVKVATENQLITRKYFR